MASAANGSENPAETGIPTATEGAARPAAGAIPAGSVAAHAGAGVSGPILPMPAAAIGMANPLKSGREVAAQHFVNLLARGYYAEAAESFAPDVRAAVTSEALAGAWLRLTDQVGPLKRHLAATGGRVLQHDVVRDTCEFAATTLDLQVIFDNAGYVAGFQWLPLAGEHISDLLYDPPDYVRQAAFHERAVEVGTPPWTLPGTVGLPMGDGPFPAVVLIQGAGPQDLDATAGPLKPFRDLAWGLASANIAALRYDKRTFVYGAALPSQPNFTVEEEVVNDALAAVALLRGMLKVDARRIFLLGHGVGGSLLPRIAARDPQIAGLIILDGIARRPEDMLMDQFTRLYTRHGPPTPEQEQQLAVLEAQVARLRDPQLPDSTPAGQLPLGLPASYWRDLRAYRPAEVARTLSDPMLVMQGERDYQATMADFEQWQAALGGRPQVELRTFPTLNPPLIPEEDRRTPDDFRAANHVPAELVDYIGNWIHRQSPRDLGGGARA
jgi:dienelactone hydrolase